MKLSKSLIIKIAFFISIAAFLFSLVTMIRNIVIGSMVFLGILQVVGSAVIVLVCYVLMRAYCDGAVEDSDEEQEDTADEEDAPKSDSSPLKSDPLDDDADSFSRDPLPGGHEADYDISLFDEKK